MNKNDSRLLSLISDKLEEEGIYSKFSEYGGEAALELIYEDAGEFAPKDCTVTVMHPKEGTTLIQLLVTMLQTDDENTLETIASLVPQFNNVLSIGAFGLMRSDGYFYLNYAFVVEPLDENGILSGFGSALQVISITAHRCGEALSAILSGKVSPDVLKEEGYGLAQF